MAKRVRRSVAGFTPGLGVWKNFQCLNVYLSLKLEFWGTTNTNFCLRDFKRSQILKNCRVFNFYNILDYHLQWM